jgi:hypothetical protein
MGIPKKAEGRPGLGNWKNVLKTYMWKIMRN